MFASAAEVKDCHSRILKLDLMFLYTKNMSEKLGITLEYADVFR